MPYIKKEDRFFPGEIGLCGAENVGELNYLITIIIKAYFTANGGRYQQINDILGVLEGVKLEFYRRIAVPYENKKKKENGDV
jgi:hypothetical protein